MLQKKKLSGNWLNADCSVANAAVNEIIRKLDKLSQDAYVIFNIEIYALCMKCVKSTLKVMQCIPEIPSFIYTILFVTSANYLLVKFHKSKSFKTISFV